MVRPSPECQPAGGDPLQAARGCDVYARCPTGPWRGRPGRPAETLLTREGGRRRRKVLDLFGKMEWDPGYDYKAERRRRG
jgi:hypothetical protein